MVDNGNRKKEVCEARGICEVKRRDSEEGSLHQSSTPHLAVRVLILVMGICCAIGSLFWAENRDVLRVALLDSTKVEIDTTLVVETVRDTMWVAPEEILHIVGDVLRLATVKSTVTRTITRTLCQTRRFMSDGRLTVFVSAEFEVTAGFDLTETGFEVIRNPGHGAPGLVEVILPPPVFLSCRLVPESLEIETSESHWDDTRAAMTEMLPEMEAELQAMAYDAAADAGLLGEAREGASAAVGGVLRALGIDEVVVSFTDDAPLGGRHDG